jgi:nucleosome binding factor SPN SPT16 subunit
LGHGIGLEFRESILIINDKNEKLLQENMVFNISLNFTGLKNNGSDYAINLCDTILITS